MGRDQYFRSSACSSMPSPSILGRDDDHNDDDDNGDGDNYGHNRHWAAKDDEHNHHEEGRGL